MSTTTPARIWLPRISDHAEAIQARHHVAVPQNGRLKKSRIWMQYPVVTMATRRFAQPLDADVALAEKIKHPKRILLVKDVTPTGTP